MTIFNIFTENQYPDYNFDELSVHKDIIKMTKYIFKDKNIMDKSCLVNQKFKSITFDIVFVNNEEIKKINSKYRQKNMSTDVITFAIFADSPLNERFIIDSDISLGEIIISLDKVKEQADYNNVTFLDELYFIISHGILHLLGFDHQNDVDYNFMVENQKKAKATVL